MLSAVRRHKPPRRLLRGRGRWLRGPGHASVFLDPGVEAKLPQWKVQDMLEKAVLEGSLSASAWQLLEARARHHVATFSVCGIAAPPRSWPHSL